MLCGQNAEFVIPVQAAYDRGALKRLIDFTIAISAQNALNKHAVGKQRIVSETTRPDNGVFTHILSREFNFHSYR
jgi:hypothetical protein